jgi:hypothetical protein
VAYINSWWFQLLPDWLQVKIMARRWRRRVRAAGWRKPGG